MLTGYVHENRKQNPNDSGQFLAGYADGGGESIYDGFFCHSRSSSLARHPHTTPARSFPAPASSAPMHHPHHTQTTSKRSSALRRWSEKTQIKIIHLSDVGPATARGSPGARALRRTDTLERAS